MDLKNIILSAAAVCTFTLIGNTVLAAGSGVKIDEDNFPDKNFREEIMVFDTDHDGVLSDPEIAEIKELKVIQKEIKSVKGIEYLTELQVFSCSENDISSIDISSNRKLQKFYCAKNNLTSIDISMLKDLKIFRCNDNHIKKLDLKNNNILERVFADGNDIKTLDLRNNPLLDKAIMESYLYRQKNNGSIVFNFRNDKSYLISFDPDTILPGYEDLIPSMTVQINETNFPDPAFRSAVSGYDTDGDGVLSLKECYDIETLDISNKKISSLEGLSHLANLNTLRCDSNMIDELDLSLMNNLQYLSCGFNCMDRLILPRQGKLTEINCEYNCLRKLDLKGLPELTSLLCGSNYLTELDLSGNPSLTKLYAQSNAISKIDRSANPKLWLFTYDNKRAPTPTPYTSRKISSQFPDKALQRYMSEKVDKNHDGLINIGELRRTEEIDLSVSYKDVKDLKGLEIFTLNIFTCKGLDLGTLDISNYNIRQLDCSNCNLTSLKFGRDTQYVICPNNRLTDIDIHDQLIVLVCPDNNITNLKIYNDCELKEVLSGEIIREEDITTYNGPDNYIPTQLIVDSNVIIETPDSDYTVPTPIPAVTSPASPAVTSNPSAVVTPKITAAVDPDASSTELIPAFVSRLYSEVLGREPEEGGIAFWSNELYNFNRTGAEVGLQFILSDEFVARNTSDSEFVSILYRTFFSRNPEQEGFDFWTSALANGSLDREQVANGFIYSQEWADTSARYGIRSGGTVEPEVTIEPTELTYAFVERMYTTALARASESSGRDFWAQELANFRYTGEQVGLMFFMSDEMSGFGLSDSEFVTRLYKTFMDREPEEGGFKFWVGYLADGGSRQNAVLGFTRSEEFVNKCIAARILPY